MRTRTKIICTMGPAVSGVDKILELIDAGMDGARLNFSHGTQEQHLRVIDDVKKARQIRGVPLAIILDTKGPEIRIGKVKEDRFSAGAKHRLLLVKDPVLGDETRLQITPAIALDTLDVGMTVLFDDGYIISKVVEKIPAGVVIEIENAATFKSHKGVNVPGVNIELPAMTEQDINDITFGCSQDVDVIAASFIRSAEHVLEIKQLLLKLGKPDILVIAKIENSLGVQNFDSIVQVADGIMVARGDLGVELPLEQVPNLQKMMIRKCYHARKPVVTATQMLESMIQNPRPTRAETSDVANAIYDSTSAVMLSGETAVGQYPVETVSRMRSIVEEAEKHFPYREFFEKEVFLGYHDVSSSVALASVQTGYSTGARAIFVFTCSGSTARSVSRFRPQMPIIALTPSVKTYHQLAINWGVIPVDPTSSKNATEAFATTIEFAKKHGIVHYGDLVVVTDGVPFGVSGTTNRMLVDSIGDVLVRGQKGYGEEIHGRVVILASSEGHLLSEVRGRIMVISRYDESYAPLAKEALGIVLQSHPEDIDSEEKAMSFAKMLGLPILARADGALTLLKEGQLVTLDPIRGIVYKGPVNL